MFTADQNQAAGGGAAGQRRVSAAFITLATSRPWCACCRVLGALVAGGAVVGLTGAGPAVPGHSPASRVIELRKSGLADAQGNHADDRWWWWPW
ncbi:MAG: hypothetical protein MZW92_51320 [Comamonadaceae bacterium]|nr:hypothetical protein [Comamonadaceae bacterium]